MPTVSCLSASAATLSLRADAVGAGDEDRVAIVAGEEPAVVIEAEQAGEAAEAVEDARRVRAAQERRHAGEGLLVEVEVEPGVAVTDGRHGCKSRSSRILYDGSRERRGESRLEQREGLIGVRFEMAGNAREEEQQLAGAFLR